MFRGLNLTLGQFDTASVIVRRNSVKYTENTAGSLCVSPHNKTHFQISFFKYTVKHIWINSEFQTAEM